MRLFDYLQKENCLMDLRAVTKEEAVAEISAALVKSGKVQNEEQFVQDILGREKLGSTGIGLKVAIPHSPTEAVDEFVLAFGRSEMGIDFQALDDDKVHLIFLMGTNPQELSQYLKLLSELSRLLRKADFREQLMAAPSAEEVVQIFKKFESE
jgi:fructose-specific phosphotransferase system IIA component